MNPSRPLNAHHEMRSLKKLALFAAGVVWIGPFCSADEIPSGPSFLKPKFEHLEDWISYIERRFQVGPVLFKRSSDDFFFVVLGAGPGAIAICDYPRTIDATITRASGAKNPSLNCRLYDGKRGERLMGNSIRHSAFQPLEDLIEKIVPLNQGDLDPMKHRSGTIIYHHGYVRGVADGIDLVRLVWPSIGNAAEFEQTIEIPRATPRAFNSNAKTTERPFSLLGPLGIPCILVGFGIGLLAGYRWHASRKHRT